MKILFPIASFAKRLRYGAIDPVRDWLAMLAVALMALAGIVVWNIWAFDTVANGGIIGPVATSTSPIFNRDSLDAIQAIFTDRAGEELKYETGTYRFADPSQ